MPFLSHAAHQEDSPSRMSATRGGPVPNAPARWMGSGGPVPFAPHIRRRTSGPTSPGRRLAERVCP